jgi:hypothetical protein
MDAINGLHRNSLTRAAYLMVSKEAAVNQLRFNFLKVGVAATIAAGLSVGSASAQPLVKGTFTLPYEVHWGKALLPPGHYSITIDDARRPALVSSTLTGQGRAVVLARAVGDALKGQPSALLITKTESARVVRSFNWSEGNQNFIYRALDRTEPAEAASAAEPVAVAILMTRQ